MDYRTPANVTLSPEQLIQFGLSLGMTPDQMKQALLSISPENHAERIFPVWKTIKLGTNLRTGADFRTALKQGGFRIGNWANDLLDRPVFKTETEEREVDLVVTTVSELGFPNGARRADIYKRAKELGLELAPAEVGPQLRLQYGDQPMGELLLIGMEPISDSDGSLKVFAVERLGDGAWLYSYCVYPDFIWHGDYRWVFVRGK